MDIKSVKHGSGNFAEIMLHSLLRAYALLFRVPEKSARAGIHGGHQHEAGRIVNGVAGARHGDVAVFERLAEHLKHAAAEFGQLVQKEHTARGQAHLAGLWATPLQTASALRMTPL